MKIAHFISSGGLYGAENVLLTLAKDFNRAPHEAYVGAIEDQRNPQLDVITRAKELGLPTFIIPCKGKYDLGSIFALKKFLKEKQINVLHTHNYKSDIIGAIAAKLAKIPIMATAHGYTDVSAHVSQYEKIDRWFLKKFFQKVVVVTDGMLPDLSSPQRIVIPNGIDIFRYADKESKRSETRQKLNLSEGDVVLANVGRLSHEKNQLLFLQAAKELIKDQQHFKFLLIGEGDEEETLKRYVQENSMEDHVKFMGLVKDMDQMYSAIDLFVLTSVTEGIPLSILESMAAKVPVVATNVGGVKEIIEDGKTGLLVPSQNLNMLVERIKALMSNVGLYNTLKQEAYIFVQVKFSEDSMVDLYREVYEKLTMPTESNPGAS